MVGDVGRVAADNRGDGPSKQMHFIVVFGEQRVVGDELNTIGVCVVNGFPSHGQCRLHTGAHDL